MIPRCQDSCYTGEGWFPEPKRSTHHRPSQVRSSYTKLERLIQQELKYLGYDMATTSSTSVYALKKRRLQIKPGSALYTAIEFHHFTPSVFRSLCEFVCDCFGPRYFTPGATLPQKVSRSKRIFSEFTQ